jgi:polyisoprenyl-teichoic acid--peptidoglycan teichoic acid transferase
VSAAATVGVLERTMRGGTAAATTAQGPAAAAAVAPRVAVVPETPAPAAAVTPAPGTAAAQDTLVFVVAEEGSAATSVTLLANAGGADAQVTFIPSSTILRIPGFGTERLGTAQRLGGPQLVLASLENALGVDLDAALATTPALLADLLGRAGELSVDGTGLDGAAAAAHWTGGDGVHAHRREQQVWAALLDALATSPDLVREVLAGGVPRTAASPEADAVAAGLLEDLVTASRSDALTYALAPVRSAGTAEDGPTYRFHRDEVEALVAGALQGSRPGGRDSLRVQVLNGVGVPGVARAVDARLDGAPLRVVLSDNAREFRHRVTRVVVYDDTAATRRAAEQVRARLGVGTIERSRQPQSMVDLTIVVGADFAP